MLSLSSWNSVVRYAKGGDGDIPEDTIVARELRAYYSHSKLSKKYPYWPEWMPGPRPANLPAPAQVSNVGSSSGRSGYGNLQQAGGDSYSQQDSDGMNRAGHQPPPTQTNDVFKGLWDKPSRTPVNAAASGGSNVLRNPLEKKTQRPPQPKPEPRPIPSQRDYSQQGREQSYSASMNHDSYKYNDSRAGAGGYESNGRSANGYGNGNSRGAREPPNVTANAPWSSGATRGSNGGYSEPSGYEQSSSRSTPNSLRTGRGLPGGLPINPRGNR